MVNDIKKGTMNLDLISAYKIHSFITYPKTETKIRYVTVPMRSLTFEHQHQVGLGLSYLSISI